MRAASILCLAVSTFGAVAHALQCHDCSASRSSNDLVKYLLGDALVDSMRREGLEWPDAEEGCERAPDRVKQCEFACVSLHVKVNFTEYRGPPVTFGAIEDLRTLEDTYVLLRTCLDTLSPERLRSGGALPALPTGGGAGSSPSAGGGCLKAKGHAVGTAAGAELCVCHSDRCNTLATVPQLPRAPPPAMAAGEGERVQGPFDYAHCAAAEWSTPTMLIVMQLLAGVMPRTTDDPLRAIMNAVNAGDGGNKKKSGAAGDGKCYVRPAADGEGDCRSIAGYYAIAVDTGGYDGPPLQNRDPNGEPITAADVRSLGSGRVVSRACADHMLASLPDGVHMDSGNWLDTAVAKDSACLQLEGTMWGARGAVAACACNGDECNAAPFDVAFDAARAAGAHASLVAVVVALAMLLGAVAG